MREYVAVTSHTLVEEIEDGAFAGFIEGSGDTRHSLEPAFLSSS